MFSAWKAAGVTEWFCDGDIGEDITVGVKEYESEMDYLQNLSLSILSDAELADEGEVSCGYAFPGSLFFPMLMYISTAGGAAKYAKAGEEFSCCVPDVLIESPSAAGGSDVLIVQAAGYGFMRDEEKQSSCV